ncbi:hypothetical protein ACMZOO_13730 [Catenovulum sp. SX2]|uniref:hypothetical protein n=1 Tax=Catenovulum sp. SX2 TaxID=3398614 RepID=UPI003F828B2C
MSLAKYLLTIICLIFGSLSAQTLQVGKLYNGPIKLSVADINATFSVPEQWQGILPQNSEVFVMQSTVSASQNVLLIAQQTDLNNLKQQMSESIDFGDGFVLVPKGQVTVIDNTQIKASYSVAQSDDKFALVISVVGEAGWAISAVGIATNQDKSALEQTTRQIASSIVFESVQAAPLQHNAWYPHLSNRKLTYFYTSSGYTEEQYIWLCGNNTFYKSFNSGGFGGGASGALASKDGGQWRTSGNLNSGTLELYFNDGRISQYTLTHEGDTKLFLDGKRWFREAINCQ